MFIVAMVSLSSFADVENALKDLEERMIASSQQAWSGANSKLEENTQSLEARYHSVEE